MRKHYVFNNVMALQQYISGNVFVCGENKEVAHKDHHISKQVVLSEHTLWIDSKLNINVFI